MRGYCKGAELEIISRRAEYGKTVFRVSKLEGDWPADKELLLFCDKLRGAPFGGRVTDMPEAPGLKKAIKPSLTSKEVETREYAEKCWQTVSNIKDVHIYSS